jgi:hypothetical protein
MSTQATKRKSGVKTHNRVRLIVFSLLLSNFILSCSIWKTEGLMEESFLTGLPCEAPCWQGLEIDKSTKSDIVAKLQELPFVEKRSIKEYGTVWIADQNAVAIRFDCASPRRFCGEFTLSKDRLKRMLFSIGYSLTFGKVVEKLDSPDSVSAGVCQPERPDCTVGLNWPGKGIFVGTHGYDGDLCDAVQKGLKIPGRTKVTEIAYSVEEAFASVEGSCIQNLPWPGFLP